jgi:predicted pore-forming effector associated with SMODS systems
MRERTLIQVAAALTTLMWVAVVVVRGAPFDLSLLSSFGAVVAVVAFSMTVLDRIVWRLPVVNMAFRRRRPMVRGTWRGHATSSRRDEPFDGFLVIDQTLSRVSVRMLTRIGWSETLAASWGTSDDGNPAIFYVWRHFPRPAENGAELEDGAPGLIHYGAGVIEICADRIKGPYWTAERHSGQLLYEGRKRKLSKSFEDASELFDVRGSNVQ